MGADFIRGQSGKPWTKRWDKGIDRLKQPSLFDVQFSLQQRVITADIDPEILVLAGEQLVVQFHAGTATVCRGQSQIGSINCLPTDVRAAIIDCGGVALGTVERVSLFGNSAELNIQ
jgi:hypothetical protein